MKHMGTAHETTEGIPSRLQEANLTVNLVKSGVNGIWEHVMGQGEITPVMAKVKAFAAFPAPIFKYELMGMSGYYRKFCCNFSVVAEPAAKKREPFIWSGDCQRALKSLYLSVPVLTASDFSKCFKLMV